MSTRYQPRITLAHHPARHVRRRPAADHLAGQPVMPARPALAVLLPARIRQQVALLITRC